MQLGTAQKFRSFLVSGPRHANLLDRYRLAEGIGELERYRDTPLKQGSPGAHEGEKVGSRGRRIEVSLQICISAEEFP